MSAKSNTLTGKLEKSIGTIRGAGAGIMKSWASQLVVLAGLLSMVAPAAAQDTGQATQALCESGVGSLIGMGLVLMTVLLGLLAAYRAAMGLSNMGSARSEKVQQGRSQVRGAGLAVLGALAPAAISYVLGAVGIPTLECIDLGSIIGQVVPLLI